MNLGKEIQLLESINEHPDADSIHVLDTVVQNLLAYKAKFLKEAGELEGEGFYPKYYVFNNLTQTVDHDTFVLDPKNSEADLESIEFYAEFTESVELKECLREWLRSHREDVCPFTSKDNEVCPIMGYNLCCGCCPNSDVCFVEGNRYLCDRVANDMFTTIKECDGE